MSSLASIPVDDEWRRWIAENLLLGASVADLVAVLQRQGVALPHALAEVNQAARSPYLAGAQVLRNRVAKRDWVLGAIGKLAALGDLSVPVLDRPGADSFFRNHYAAHRPALISGWMEEWPATRLWSLDYFAERLGDPEVSVQTRRERNASYEIESGKHRTAMPLSQLLAMLREDRTTNDFYLTANNSDVNRTALAPLWDDIGDIPGVLAQTPVRSGFFWMGPRGTVTPFHHDLTNNLLAQVRGRKKVWLVPSWETPKMRNHRHCFTTLAGPAALAALPEAERPQLLEVVIEPGQMLFLPVGWWHHVEGLDMTIGLSFTNFVWDNDFHSRYGTYDAV